MLIKNIKKPLYCLLGESCSMIVSEGYLVDNVFWEICDNDYDPMMVFDEDPAMLMRILSKEDKVEYLGIPREGVDLGNKKEGDILGYYILLDKKKEVFQDVVTADGTVTMITKEIEPWKGENEMNEQVDFTGVLRPGDVRDMHDEGVLYIERSGVSDDGGMLYDIKPGWGLLRDDNTYIGDDADAKIGSYVYPNNSPEDLKVVFDLEGNSICTGTRVSEYVENMDTVMLNFTTCTEGVVKTHKIKYQEGEPFDFENKDITLSLTLIEEDDNLLEDDDKFICFVVCDDNLLGIFVRDIEDEWQYREMVEIIELK